MEKNWILGLILLATLWTIPWKGLALWRAAKRGDKFWFIALLLINTLAILEIFYLFVIGKNKEEEKPELGKTNAIAPRRFL
jgi:hypothetical protein